MDTEIVFGPPGTGKTRTLVDEVEEEIERGTPVERIAYVSFTRRAAREAISRCMQRFGYSRDKFPYFRTLHSLCFRASGLHRSEVFDGSIISEFGNWLGVDVSGIVNHEEGGTFGNKQGDRALFMVNLARIRETPLRELYLADSDGLSWNLVAHVAEGLDRYKKAHGLVDYTDMLQRFTENGSRPDVDVVIVDEGQDLSTLQWSVVNKLADGARRLIVAGDDDQAIYRWAGADSGHLLRMRGEIRVLDKSYRVPITVQGLSQHLISRIQSRRDKDWSARDEIGSVSFLPRLDLVDWSGEDILVLARNAYFLEDLEQSLRSKGIVYSKRGNPSVAPEIMSAVRNWETLRSGGTIEVDEARQVYGYIPSGKGVKRGYKKLQGLVGKIDLKGLVDAGGLETTEVWHEALSLLPERDRLYILEARRQGERFQTEPRVKLNTIHGSKGGESSHVVLISDMASRTWREYDKHPDDEARVWYVGTSRTKKDLTIIAPQTTKFYDLQRGLGRAIVGSFASTNSRSNT